MQILRPEDRKRRRLAYWLVMGGGGPRGLIGNGTLSAPLTLTRAQAAGVQATGLTNIGWQTYGADGPRFVLPNSGLLIGGQRTNAFTHPRLPWDGLSLRIAVTRGAGATAPIGSVTTDRLVETTATSDHYIEGLVTIPANQVNTYSVFLRPAGRTTIILRAYDSTTYADGIGCTATLTGSGSVGSTFNGGAGVTLSSAISDAGNGWYRVTFTGTVSAAANNVRPRIALVNVSTTYTGDGVSGVDVWGLQVEAGSFASTPILPPVGTPGASTRGGDIVTAPLSSLGIPASGACTVLWRGAFDVSNIGTQQTIVAVDDGSSNRYDIRLAATGIPEILRVTGGATAQSGFGGVAPTPSATVRAGISINGAGRLAGVVAGYNGGAALNVTGGPTAGLTTFRLGTSQTGAAREMWGTTERLQVLPRVVSDAELAALVATF